MLPDYIQLKQALAQKEAIITQRYMLKVLDHLAKQPSIQEGSCCNLAQDVQYIQRAPTNDPQIVSLLEKLKPKVHNTIVPSDCCACCGSTNFVPEENGVSCSNGHPWDQCMFTGSLLVTPNYRQCHACHASAFSIPQPGWVNQYASKTTSCLYCLSLLKVSSVCS